MKETKDLLFKSHFGLHLTLDAYGCDVRTLNSKERTARFLSSMVRALKMRILFGPVVVKADANDKKDPGGFSGFVMIQESHISVHTFPRRRFVSIDVYSCTDFDYAQATKFAKRFYKTSSVETNVIVRGKCYPRTNLV